MFDCVRGGGKGKIFVFFYSMDGVKQQKTAQKNKNPQQLFKTHCSSKCRGCGGGGAAGNLVSFKDISWCGFFYFFIFCSLLFSLPLLSFFSTLHLSLFLCMIKQMQE